MQIKKQFITIAELAKLIDRDRSTCRRIIRDLCKKYPDKELVVQNCPKGKKAISLLTLLELRPHLLLNTRNQQIDALEVVKKETQRLRDETQRLFVNFDKRIETLLAVIDNLKKALIIEACDGDHTINIDDLEIFAQMNVE